MPTRSAGFTKKNIIANPNCSTAQLVVALKPLHDKATIKRVVVATYQSVSGAGKDAMDELFSQTKAVFTLGEVETKKFPKRIAFNVIPQIDVFMEDGYTKEEWKMMMETKKILDPKIKLTATCVRVPVFVGHSEAVNVEFENPISVEEARTILRNAPGCLVIDKHEPGGYVTPYECVGEDATYISRIRTDPTVDNGLQMWVVSDNLRKGAALNAIQIAEVPDQPQAHQGEEEGGVIISVVPAKAGTQYAAVYRWGTAYWVPGRPRLCSVARDDGGIQNLGAANALPSAATRTNLPLALSSTDKRSARRRRNRRRAASSLPRSARMRTHGNVIRLSSVVHRGGLLQRWSGSRRTSARRAGRPSSPPARSAPSNDR